MKKLTEKHKLIIASVWFGVSLAFMAGVILFIGLDNEGILSDDAKVAMFFIAFACVCLGIYFFVGQMKAKKRSGKAVNNNNYAPPVQYVSEQNPEEDVIRVPVEFDNEQGKAEQEFITKKFLENITFPKGFKKYLGADDNKRVFIKVLDTADCVYYETDEKYPEDKIKEINEEMLIFRDDYFTQFREVLFFADDESGHMHFLLDYGTGGEPQVKILDDELDEVYLLAENFEEFLSGLYTPKEAKEELGKDYYGYYEED